MHHRGTEDTENCVIVSHRGIVRSLGAQWNQSRDHGDQYIRVGPEEKAAALDAAIEFEDRLATEIETTRKD